jgi:PAS domain S-box-containing protein
MHRREDRSGAPIGQRSLPADPVGAEQLVSLSHDLMGAVDHRRRLVWTNPAWKEVLGWEPEELAGVVYSDLLHPDDRPSADAAERALMGGAGRWTDTEFRVRTRAGDYRWILWSGVAAPGQGLLYISGKDVSARNEALAERALDRR